MSKNSVPLRDFTGCVVHCKTFPYLNGRTVVRTFKRLLCKNSASSLYEVQLNHAKRHYFLYEDEMKEIKSEVSNYVSEVQICLQ